MGDSVSRGTPPPPISAAGVFHDRLPLAVTLRRLAGRRRHRARPDRAPARSRGCGTGTCSTAPPWPRSCRTGRRVADVGQRRRAARAGAGHRPPRPAGDARRAAAAAYDVPRGGRRRPRARRPGRGAARARRGAARDAAVRRRHLARRGEHRHPARAGRCRWPSPTARCWPSRDAAPPEEIEKASDGAAPAALRDARRCCWSKRTGFLRRSRWCEWKRPPRLVRLGRQRASGSPSGPPGTTATTRRHPPCHCDARPHHQASNGGSVGLRRSATCAAPAWAGPPPRPCRRVTR